MLDQAIVSAPSTAQILAARSVSSQRCAGARLDDLFFQYFSAPSVPTAVESCFGIGFGQGLLWISDPNLTDLFTGGWCMWLCASDCSLCCSLWPLTCGSYCRGDRCGCSHLRPGQMFIDHRRRQPLGASRTGGRHAGLCARGCRRQQWKHLHRRPSEQCDREGDSGRFSVDLCRYRPRWSADGRTRDQQQPESPLWGRGGRQRKHLHSRHHQRRRSRR